MAILNNPNAIGEVRPPMSLETFLAQMHISAATAWRMRKRGELITTNIHGRLYVLPEAIADFNRRAAAGDFASHHVTPTSPRPTALRASKRSRERRLAA